MTYLKGVRIGDRVQPPPILEDLLRRPLVAFMATIRADGTLQCNPMWFEYDGRNILLSHTNRRQKWRNIQSNPSVSLAIADPDNSFRYIEIRGRMASYEEDVEASFHSALRIRYGMAPGPVSDAADRIVITVEPSFIGGREMDDPTAKSSGEYHRD